MTKVRKFNKTGRSSLTDSVFASQRKGCGRYILVILMARVYPDIKCNKSKQPIKSLLLYRIEYLRSNVIHYENLPM